ncbi:MAG TPA: secondary thiamine-phosphate synthase enzyme YjbQ [Gaiellales bacterium]|nr:secondary thiamine-phosphate synthase enzyme YjbQ [Gaiellales bacterium]
MTHVFANHDLQTERGDEFIDVTDEVRDVVAGSDIENGMALVYSPHTTSVVVINERESGFMEDLRELLEQVAPREGRYYRHDDLTIRTEGLDGDPHEIPNGHAHCRAALMSTSQTIPVVDGDLRLGRWQRIFFCELDRARPRKVFIQVIGE